MKPSVIATFPAPAIQSPARAPGREDLPGRPDVPQPREEPDALEVPPVAARPENPVS